MKKFISLILTASLLLSLAACGTTGNEKSENNNKTDVSENNEAVNKDYGKIDVDLTVLSSTVVYSEVYAMVNTPNKYLGKTVKMNGAFNVLESEEMGRNYYTCIIKDATACCAQGLEFVLSDTSLKFPDDYPKQDEEVTVVGTFDTYNEGENVYCQLKDAVMI